MKIKLFYIALILIVISCCNVLFGQYKLFEYEEMVKFDTSLIKNRPAEYHYRLSLGNKVLLHHFKDVLVGDIQNIDNEKYFFFFLNPNDPEIYIFKEASFSWTSTRFIFNNNLYFIAERGNNKKKHSLLVKVDLINKRLKEFSFKGGDVSIVSILEEYTVNFDSTSFTTDDKGNMKVLCKFYKTNFSLLNAIFFFVRDMGNVWQIDRTSEKRRWYVFDDDLNLLYTEDVK